MALIKCPECGKEISDQAVSCPNCGTPINKTEKKFCQHCGESIDKDCVICPKCGKQVSELKNNGNDKNIIINNNNSASASASATANVQFPYANMPKPKNKWTAFLLCLFLGFIGIHKFYEGKVLMGILYIFTFGLFGIGVLVDLIIILMKPNPYYV